MAEPLPLPCPVPWAPAPASLTWPSSENRGVERRVFLMGRSVFLGFNEIIYCLFALTKIVNVTGEI